MGMCGQHTILVLGTSTGAMLGGCLLTSGLGRLAIGS